MTDYEISELISQEFDLKLLGVTEQYLEIHEPVYENGLLKIDRIDREKDDVIIAYLPVKGEYFFFAVYFDPISNQILNISTESRNIVSLIVSSETMTSKELLNLTNLQCSKFWDKGDLRPNTKRKYTFTGIEFYLVPEPDEFEDKLRKLLDYLETDKSGILALSSKGLAYIKVCMDFHYCNQLLGGFTLDVEILKKISDLNLKLDFQITAWGKPFR